MEKATLKKVCRKVED